MLYKGKLKIKIHEDNMTSDKYVDLVNKWMPKALRQMGVPSTSKTRCILIQDKERAINTLDVKTAMKKEQTPSAERYTRTIASVPRQGVEISFYRTP